MKFSDSFPLYRTVYYWHRTGEVFLPGCAAFQIALERSEFETICFISLAQYQICYKKDSAALSLPQCLFPWSFILRRNWGTLEKLSWAFKFLNSVVYFHIFPIGFFLS